jgi:hypothetical protein
VTVAMIVTINGKLCICRELGTRVSALIRGSGFVQDFTRRFRGNARQSGIVRSCMRIARLLRQDGPVHPVDVALTRPGCLHRAGCG